MSLALESGSIATLIVRARSAAEMPVVTPVDASMLMVKFVPKVALLLLTINGMLRRFTISASSGRQIRPLPCFAMKLIFSGVIVSAAQTRSPSFSRSSSSTTTNISPLAKTSMASSMVLKKLLFSGIYLYSILQNIYYFNL